MEEYKRWNIVSVSLIFMLFMAAIALCFMVSCTISFQNISTHGTATDLVDENMTTSPKVDATVTAPLSPM